MNSEFPQFKDEMKKISVPEDELDQIISKAVRKTRTKGTLRRKAFYTTSAAAAGFVLFISSAIYSPAIAKIASEIPVVGTFFSGSGDEGLEIAGAKGLTQTVGKSSTDKGITLTINEVFYDGTRLALGFTHESLLAIGEMERPAIYVDGKEINFSSGSSGKFVTPAKYQGILDINPTEELPEEFTMKFSVDAVGLMPGKWEFEFPVKQSGEVTVIRPNETQNINGLEVNVNSVKLGPAGTDLSVSLTAYPEQTKLDPYTDLHFNIVDDQGFALRQLSGSGHGETVDGKEKATLSMLFSPVKEGTKSLRIIPYKLPAQHSAPEEVMIPLNEGSLPAILEQGGGDKITVTDIERTKKSTTLFFRVDSKFAYDDQLTKNPTILETAAGENLTIDKAPFAERVEGNLYKQVFKATGSKELIFKAFVMPEPEMFEAFTVELP
jgi:hypothetical protein